MQPGSPQWLLLQHVAYEGPGLFAAALSRHGVGLNCVRPYAGDRVPEPIELERYTGVLAMGGPMNALDDASFQFLPAERLLLAAAARAGVPVIGVCLGAQLLAAGLGADVSQMGEPEIGIGDVWLTDEGRRDPAFAGSDPKVAVVHWHGDAFGVPAGGQLLASTDHCATQAFRWGERAYGLQFHVEMTSKELREVGAQLPAELADHETLLASGAAQRARWLNGLVAQLTAL